MLNPQALPRYINQKWKETIIPSLCDYIKIPCKSPSFDAQWQENGYMEQAISHIAEWCKANAPARMHLEIIRLPNRTPLLFIEIAGDLSETVLLYGHLDKQPEMEGWESDLNPWQPVIKNNRLYGRGAADDGYAIYAALTSIKALQTQGLDHARYVIIIEACEESGSYDLPFYIDMLNEKIGQPSLIVCLDSGAGNYEQLWVTTSLRGNIVGELSVELIREGVHSGYASGIVADSFRVARQLISRLEEEKTGEIKLKALHCHIPDERIKEAAICANVLKDKVYNGFPFLPCVEPVRKSNNELILNRTWRPALTVIGVAGLPAITEAGNVIRPKTTLKLSMRLPPLTCAAKAAKIMQETLEANPPYQAKVAFHVNDAGSGWNAPPMAEWLAEAVYNASMTFYQKPAISIGEGGSIPFMRMLGEKFPKAQFMITGVLGPHSNAHGPNEFLDIEMAKKITACVAYVLNQHYNFYQTFRKKI